jgi:hypothetical protein
MTVEAVVPVSITPVDLLRIAVSQDADIDKLKQLMDLQERWEANEARKAFVSAMNEFKKNPPAITKNKDVAFGNTKYSHATLDHVCDAVTKGLSEHGISHRWRVDQSTEWITVTCVLTHALGHSEETALKGIADTSGSKNSIQAIGSTVTYLQRYTLLSATGLAAGGTDNDGRGDTSPGAPQRIPADKVSEQCEWIANAHDVAELEKMYKNAYRAAMQVNDKLAMARYIAAKDSRKKEL